jgi:hypothetical protein
MTGYLNFHLNYQHQFDEPGHMFASSLQYTRGWEDESYFLNDSSKYRQATDFTHIIATEHTTLYNLDYIRPLSFGRFESGLKLQWRSIPVTYEIGRVNNRLSTPVLEAGLIGEKTSTVHISIISMSDPSLQLKGGSEQSRPMSNTT